MSKLAFKNILVLDPDVDFRRQLVAFLFQLLDQPKFFTHDIENTGLPDENYTWDNIDLAVMPVNSDREKTYNWYKSTLSKVQLPPIIFVDESHASNEADILALGHAAYVARREVTLDSLQSQLSTLASMAQGQVSKSAEQLNPADVNMGLTLQDPTIDWPFTPDQVNQGKAILGNYRITDFMGSGGMAYVFEAEHMQDKRRYAIKILSSSFKDDSIAMQRFKREYELFKDVNHRNIARIYGQHEDRGYIYNVMELLPMGDLSARIRHHPKLEDTIRIIAQIAAALHHTHQLNILHRDLKPSNILFRDQFNIALVDFGIAKRIESDDSALTQQGQLVATPYYASPEQALGEKSTQQSDLYALGVILFEMLEGRRPFTGETYMDVLHAHVTEAIPKLSQDGSVLNEIIAVLLAKERSERIQSAAELIRLLHKVSPGTLNDNWVAETT